MYGLAPYRGVGYREPQPLWGNARSDRLGEDHAGQGSFYRSQHELIGVFRVGATPPPEHDRTGAARPQPVKCLALHRSEHLQGGRINDLRAHPTVKPVAMVADAMKDCTRRKEIVLDSFCGSARRFWRQSGLDVA